jgi:hypothetical protein
MDCKLAKNLAYQYNRYHTDSAYRHKILEKVAPYRDKYNHTQAHKDQVKLYNSRNLAKVRLISLFHDYSLNFQIDAIMNVLFDDPAAQMPWIIRLILTNKFTNKRS